MDVMNEQDLVRFEFKMGFDRIFYIASAPWEVVFHYTWRAPQLGFREVVVLRMFLHGHK